MLREAEVEAEADALLYGSLECLARGVCRPSPAQERREHEASSLRGLFGNQDQSLNQSRRRGRGLTVEDVEDHTSRPRMWMSCMRWMRLWIYWDDADDEHEDLDEEESEEEAEEEEVDDEEQRDDYYQRFGQCKGKGFGSSRGGQGGEEEEERSQEAGQGGCKGPLASPPAQAPVRVPAEVEADMVHDHSVVGKWKRERPRGARIGPVDEVRESASWPCKPDAG